MGSSGEALSSQRIGWSCVRVPARPTFSLPGDIRLVQLPARTRSLVREWDRGLGHSDGSWRRQKIPVGQGVSDRIKVWIVGRQTEEIVTEDDLAAGVISWLRKRIDKKAANPGKRHEM